MGRNKAGKFKKDNSAPTKSAYYFDADDEDMRNDEVDAFHKQRDVVPLDVNEDVGESDDEDKEHPVLDLEDGEEDEDEDNEYIENDSELTGLAAKIARQQKYLLAKRGGAEDEMDDDAEEEEERTTTVWSRSKGFFYHGDNTDFELQSSDEEAPAEEEAEVVRLQKEKANLMSVEDFGLEDTSDDESNREPTIEETLVKGRPASKAALDKEPKDGTSTIEVRKDLNALTKEEQMDVVYSSAPELVGLLSELNYAFEELENKVNPLLSKIAEGKVSTKGGLHYLEVKRLLLLSYSQAITFYLLLKSEGRSARDHPVISWLVEIRTLLDKMKELDGNLPAELEDIINKNNVIGEQVNFAGENAGSDSDSDSLARGHKASRVSSEIGYLTEPYEVNEMVDVSSPKDSRKSGLKRKHQDHDIGLQSMEMLKVRAALEERLKQKGVFTSLSQRNDRVKKHQQPINGQLMTLDDFDDDALAGNSSERSSKLSHLVTAQVKKPKLTSGDDDLPKRDDIGERRRKHEMRALAGAGIESVDNGVQDEPGDGDSESDFEVYKQVERQHAVKVAAKAEMYSRPSKVPPLPETDVDGKRHITYQIEKNRGLTRQRKKLTKNPRKKYRVQHEKAITRRKGQVRELRKPSGPYGGEVSGINAGISRSVRFKN